MKNNKEFKQKPNWSEEENKFLKENYALLNSLELSVLMNRSPAAIMRRAHLLGLFKGRHLKIEEGSKFNNLTVIKSIINNKNRTFLLCKCDCGNEKLLRATSVINSVIKSCGCLSIKQRALIYKYSIKKSPGEATLNTLENICRKGAERRGHSYELSKENFREIIKQNCHYCNSEPQKKSMYAKEDGSPRQCAELSNMSDKTINDSWVKANGIDRKDPKLGYILSNCVPCCKFCNFIKREMSYEAFISHLLKIIVNMNEKK